MNQMVTSRCGKYIDYNFIKIIASFTYSRNISYIAI